MSFKFECPHCGQRIEVEDDHAGIAAVCPACAGEILVPIAPTQGTSPNPAPPNSGRKHPPKSRTQIAVACVVVTLGLGVAAVNKQRFHAGPATKSETPMPMVQAQMEPEQLLDRYFACKTWKERVPLVRDPERVKPLMESYYKSDELPQMEHTRLTRQTRYRQLIIPVRLGSAGTPQETKLYWFVKAGNEWRIDWEASAGFNPLSWAAFRSDRRTEPARFRCVVSLDDYYNYDFTDQSKWMSMRLGGPGTPGLLYGFVQRDSFAGRWLRELLADGEPHHVTLDVRHTSSKGNSNCLEVVRLVTPGWVLLDSEKDTLKSTVSSKPDDEIVDVETGKAIAAMHVMGAAAGAKWANQYGRLPTRAEFTAFLAESNITAARVETGTPQQIKMNRLVIQALRDGFEQGCKGVLRLEYDANRPAF